MIRKYTLLLFTAFFQLAVTGQAPPTVNSADIYLQLKKLKVLGAVLYVAAHPDDENTRLLAYMAKERLYRTGYLSLTRGDGGQNLIGNEQGIDLGLIRTQELLSARRIDGAEQFFSRAYDFGFSKTTAEALRVWDKEKILSDAVWIIRKFQPDVIITRFPPDSRAGHGHHSGSAVIAAEAFRAAGDPSRFPEQLKLGVKPWKAKRIVWNSFLGAGSGDSVVRLDVGAYNPLLGKSYGEIAALSRSQHKSQGFGVAGSRGEQMENFLHTDGTLARQDLFDGVDVSWKRVKGGESFNQQIDELISTFSFTDPSRSVAGLVKLYRSLESVSDTYWKSRKLGEVKSLIESCSGIWLEASSNAPFAVQGDSLRLQVTVNNRLGADASLAEIIIDSLTDKLSKKLDKNVNTTINKMVAIRPSRPLSQPYWLENKMNEGSFVVNDQQKIGLPENEASLRVSFRIVFHGLPLVFEKPVRYKFTDPVKGEIYQPLNIIPAVSVTTDPAILVFKKSEPKTADFLVRVHANRNFQNYTATVANKMHSHNSTVNDSAFSLSKGLWKDYHFRVDNSMLGNLEQDSLLAKIELRNGKDVYKPELSLVSIQYDHIPDIHYHVQDNARALNLDLKTVGERIGYIEGAGDKVPQALQQMGYDVVLLKEHDITLSVLQQFDAVIAGVRAYNVHSYLSERNYELMEYVKQGGNLIVQYNTNSFAGPLGTRIGPYPFTISRNRVTDQNAQVKFLLPEHDVLNFPNKITARDFEGWIQERGLYFADQPDPHYQMPLGMADPDESEQKGSLIITDYGKGKFVYTGLAFFRELPAGVPGAYRLIANIIALSKKRAF
ncbi:MAG: PIG-L family deacetylase [Chitinophagaceae bacterium]|nr:MAG: PIG-L family deacetylase [Chitinophagaceae bacterium]